MESYKILMFSLFFCAVIHQTPKVSSQSHSVCEVYPEPDFTGPPLLSLKHLDTIYESNLTLVQTTPIKSILLEANCKLLACSLPKLKGNCEEHSISGSLRDAKTFKSFACKCPSKANANTNACGQLYENWFYTGPSQKLVFPGSTTKLELATIKSTFVKEGCEIMVWKQERDNKQHSSTFKSSFTFVNSQFDSDENEGDGEYDWSCCYCGKSSQRICKYAMNISTFENQAKEYENEDFSQFVKYGKKIIGIGRNYRWKVSELAKVLKEPTEPIVFLKPSTAYIQEGQKIQLPESLGTIFYEIELGVVIGKGGKSIPKSKALDHVAGYFLALDMTAKEFLKKSLNNALPWEISKGFDTACPVSHFIPKHLIPSPDDIRLECKVNGNVTQSDNTKNMIFDVSTLISYISKYMTLQPFDTIITGTPDGLGPITSGDVIQGVLGNVTTIRFDVVSVKD